MRAGAVVNTYNSDAPAGGRGGRGGRGGGAAAVPEPMIPDAAMAAGRFAPRQRRPSRASRRTTGMNRFIWDVRHQSGLAVPPGCLPGADHGRGEDADAAVHRAHRSQRRRGRCDRRRPQGAVRAQHPNARARGERHRARVARARRAVTAARARPARTPTRRNKWT